MPKILSEEEQLTQMIQEAFATHGGSGGKFIADLKSDMDQINLRLSSRGAIIVDFSDKPGLAGSKSIYVGKSQLPDEARIHNGKAQHRSLTKDAFIDFTYPTIDDIWNDVRGCAVLAAIAAVVAAILAEQYAAARATFYPTFYACLVSKLGDEAKKVGVDFHTEEHHGNWHSVHI